MGTSSQTPTILIGDGSCQQTNFDYISYELTYGIYVEYDDVPFQTNYANG
jgi:hypothetical protein